MKDPRRFWAVLLDGTKTRIAFDLDGTAADLVPAPPGVHRPKGSQLVLMEGVDAQVVESLRLSADISYEAAVFDRAEGEHHVYGLPNGPSIQHSGFSGEIFGLPVKLDHQTREDGSQTSSVEWPSGVRLPSQWAIPLPKHGDAEPRSGADAQ